jgi:hypothetical protein
MDEPNPIASLAILLIVAIVGLSIVMFCGLTFTGPPM